MFFKRFSKSPFDMLHQVFSLKRKKKTVGFLTFLESVLQYMLRVGRASFCRPPGGMSRRIGRTLKCVVFMLFPLFFFGKVA